MSRYYDEYNDVYVDALPSRSDASEQRNYLTDRLYGIQGAKVYELRKTFGLENDEYPKTPQELVDRILAGQFVLDDETKNKNTGGYRLTDYIKWRDPSVKEDLDGFKAAMQSFEKAWIRAKDDVMTKPADAAVSVVQSLEDWKPEGR